LAETLEQAKAFDYYYSLGKDRNLKRVAKRAKKSLATIKNWSRQHKWPEHVEQRDSKNAKKIMEKTDELILNTKEEYRELIKKAVDKYFQDFLAGKLAVKNIQDFERLVKLDLQLMGEMLPEQVNVQVNIEQHNNKIIFLIEKFVGIIERAAELPPGEVKPYATEELRRLKEELAAGAEAAKPG
jgi:hypothetical protein